jgi:hypothetical protein
MIVLLLGLQACANAGRPVGDASVPPHLRRVGPAGQGSEVVLRFGDRLEVTPPARPGGWPVTGYPAEILRLDGGAAAAAGHTFDAIAVGQGQISFGSFTVRVRVMRDLVQPPRP